VVLQPGCEAGVNNPSSQKSVFREMLEGPSDLEKRRQRETGEDYTMRFVRYPVKTNSEIGLTTTKRSNILPYCPE